MATAVDETRHFESAVELTPEESQENLDYFREQGLQADYEGEVGEPPSKTEPEAQAATPEVEVPPADQTAEGHDQAVAAGEDIDPESRGEWHAAKNDGEKLGRLAKKTKQINELKSTVAQKDGQIDELRRQLAEKPSASSPAAAAPSISLDPRPVAESQAAPAAEAPKPKEFEKPRPVRPKYDDFVTADDPIAAYQEALGEYNETVIDWKDEKRDFDAEQKRAVSEQTAQAERLQSIQAEHQREIDSNLAAARTAHPDFDQITSGKFTPVLSYVLREVVPDGFEIGYELSKPENAQILADLAKLSRHTATETQQQIEQRITKTTYALAKLDGTFNPKPKAEEPKQPPPTSESAPPPKEAKIAQPRSEEAAPAPIRSRGAAGERLEDIPAGDYDRRKKWRQEHGEL